MDSCCVYWYFITSQSQKHFPTLEGFSARSWHWRASGHMAVSRLFCALRRGYPNPQAISVPLGLRHGSGARSASAWRLVLSVGLQRDDPKGDLKGTGAIQRRRWGNPKDDPKGPAGDPRGDPNGSWAIQRGRRGDPKGPAGAIHRVGAAIQRTVQRGLFWFS